MQFQYSDRIKDIRPSAIREILKYAATHPGVIALSTGSPSNEAVPVEELREISTRIFAENPIRSITVVRMTVPCCGGLSYAAETAIAQCGKQIPLQIVTISPDGQIIK